MSPRLQFCCALLFCLVLSPAWLRAPAQTAATSVQKSAAATLSGTVSDPSGARVRRAAIHVAGEAQQRDTVTDAGGSYTLSLPPGNYEITVTAPGFDPFVRSVTLSASVPVRADASLVIATQADVVNVQSDLNAPSTAAADNRSALVFKGAELNTLSDDDATLQQQLLAIAGNDGQHPPQVYVDGFSGGQFPPKSSIREIRINQNPYSAQYDSLGFGRLEIFTKPGSDQLHGYFSVFGNNSALNSRNPFNPGAQPPYYRINFEGNVTGPIDKKTSFFLNGQYNDQQNNAIIDATILNPTLQPTAIFSAIPDPRTVTDWSGRLDRQLTTNNTSTIRYEYNSVAQTNAGITLYTLPSEAYNNSTATQTLQLGNTEVIGAHIISETRFQYIRTRLNQSPASNAPSILVEGAFNGGGNPAQSSLSDNQDAYELQQYVSVDHKKHFIRAGLRYRFYRESNRSLANYNGQFIFPSITAYQITQQGLANGESDAQIRSTCTTTNDVPVCGGATQFSLTAGQSNAAVFTGDIGLYAEDEWKLRKDVTVNYGFRFESQSAIPDHSDPAPRLGIAWAVHQTEKKPAIVVLRGGGGLFYDRFSTTNLLTAVRQGHAEQQVYYVGDPSFYNCANTDASGSSAQCTVPASSTYAATGTPPTTYQLSPNFRSQYELDTGASAEIALGKRGSVTVNYLYGHGVHEWNSRNINAPLPGTYVFGSPNSGTRPLGNNLGNIYQFQSEGTYNGRFFFGNANLNFGKHLSAFAFYSIPRAKSDASGPASFASNSYNLEQDYGRTPWQRRQQFFGGFDAPLFKGFELNAFLAARGGQPFNVTTGQDNNGDTQYNDRPAFATGETRASVVCKSASYFNATPAAGQAVIPINYCNSPAFISLQMRAAQTFKFGPRPPAPPPPPDAKPSATPPPPPDPRYSLTFSVEAQNLTNTVSPAQPIGVLTSPYFGQSINTANSFLSTSGANRTVLLRSAVRF